MMETQQLLLENLLTNLQQNSLGCMNGESRLHICTFPLFKGIPIRIGNELQAKMWKDKAVQIEQRCKERRQQNFRMLRDKMKDIESSLERKHNMSSLDTDNNHNHSVSNVEENAKYLVGGGLSLDYQAADCKIVSDGSILRSCLHLSDQEEIAAHVAGSCMTDGIPQRVDDEKESSGNRTGNTELVPEVQQQIQELHHLQEQQKQLDHWYLNMQKELELEKVRLAERYDQIRLQNIKEQQKLIENSQEYLKNSFASNAELCKTINAELPESSSNINQHQNNDHEHELHIASPKYTPKSEQHVSPTIEMEGVISTLTTPMAMDFPSSNIQPSSQPFNPSPSLSEVTTGLSHLSTDVAPIGIITNGDHPNPIHHATTPRNSNPNPQELSPKNSPSTPVTAFVYKDTTRKSTAGDLLSQHYHMVDDKFRRKSRAMKFFTTPISSEKHSNASPFLTPENPSNTAQTAGIESGTSTSTPHEVENVLKVPYDLSPVFADEIPFLADYETPVSQSKPDSLPSRSMRTDLIIALFKGYIVRRLLKTNKVKEIVKTIKDTNLTLQDIENEAEGRKSLTTADKQLRTRLHDEVYTKHQKLHDIFFEMSTTEQMRLISISRRQESEKKLKNNKKVEGVKTQHVKLSAASQKSIQRRAQQPKQSPILKTDKAAKTKKQLTSSESRVLKPIQSNSPTFKRRTTQMTASTSSKKITSCSPLKTNRTTKNRYSSAQA